MIYVAEFRPRAMKDLADLPMDGRARVVAKIEAMCDNLAGDVKKLTNFTPEYRLRVGDYRVLFEIEDTRIIVHRVIHRSEAYR